jgi:retinol dehydrogenase 12
VSHMTGRIVLVTGATSGIGLVTARELARQGATVILHGRNPTKGAAAVAAVREETGSDTVEFLAADLGSMDAIEAAAVEFAERFPRLDVLVNNAGAMHKSRKTTADGFEMTFGVNHLAYFALTLRLIPALLQGEAPRIVNVASRAHRVARGMPWDDLQAERRYFHFARYAESKLANILFSRELARRLDGTGITVNSLHPGMVRTNFALNDEGWIKAMWSRVTLFALSPEQGAATSIYLASSPSVAGVTGEYFDKCRPVQPTRFGTDDDAAARLWTISEQLTGMTLTLSEA